MEAIIEKAIKEAREKGRGKIISRDDIYNAIFKAGIRLVVEWMSKKFYPEEEGQEFWVSDEDWPHSGKDWVFKKRWCDTCWQAQKKVWFNEKV